MKILPFRTKGRIAGALSVLLALIAVSNRAMGQTANGKPEMADAMRANGKIYVVVLVLVTILVLLIIFLAIIDRKISKIEKSIDQP